MEHGGAHHLHMRRKRGGAPFPHPVPWKRALDYVMVLVSIAGPLALVPQVSAIWTTHDVEGLSLITWALLGSLNVLWILYGLAHKTYPIVISSTAFFVLYGCIVTGILLFR